MVMLEEAKMTVQDQDFLLYPLDAGEDPICPGCGMTMMLAAAEVRENEPDLLTFRCDRCGRSERLVCEEVVPGPS
jgi:predicted RNA-binding Zn-ribbon protein involved in translation (DUF1610 family)